ncbi:orotidine 5'-phosphate decarboxylase [Candidatus Dependentiae bacterium]|nr:orotidine 5'-phosphate decarboxylase [Candidatus Dependentiae bacterium]
MKLQIAFDMTDLEKAVSIATAVAPYASILEIGSLLLLKHGVKAVETFREVFPDKILLADAKIVDRGKHAVTLLAQAGADWITVMAGTTKDVIHSASTTAHEFNKSVMLDLLDSCSLGQSALEAKSIGVNALLFHRPYEQREEAFALADKWEMVRGNTNLPIFISGRITKDSIDKIKAINPDGLIIGKPITDAASPEDEAKFFFDAFNG